MNAPLRPNFNMSHDELVRAFRSVIRPRQVIAYKADARFLLSEPGALDRALGVNLYGPVPTSISGRLQACRARIGLEQQLAASRSFTHSRPRLIGLITAEIALRYQRRFGGREVVPMHEVEAA